MHLRLHFLVKRSVRERNPRQELTSSFKIALEGSEKNPNSFNKQKVFVSSFGNSFILVILLLNGEYTTYDLLSLTMKVSLIKQTDDINTSLFPLNGLNRCFLKF